MAGSPLTTKAAAAAPTAGDARPASKAAKVPDVVGEEKARPVFATAALVVMAASGFAAMGLGIYYVVWGGNFFGGLVEFLLGFVYAYGARALQKGESWGWGAGVFGGVLFALFGLVLLPYAVVTMALGVVVLVLMVLARKHFGLIRIDPRAEERDRTALKALRTKNPRGLKCPHCGSTSLWLSPDGSAFCDACKKGILSIRRTA